MVAFNTFYYSFSPMVASFISDHHYARVIMRGALYPFILSLSGMIPLYADIPNQETAVIAIGALSAFSLGLEYFGMPLALLMSIQKETRLTHLQPAALWTAFVCGASVCRCCLENC